MDGLTGWTLNQYVVIAGFAGVFGLVGLKRGVRRELYVLGALLLAIAVTGFLADALEEPINRFYYLQRFARAGGLSAENPSAVWQEVREAPPLIETDKNRGTLRLSLLAGFLGASYLVGRRLARPRTGIIDGLLGMLVGLLNGVALLYILLPIVFPAPTATIALSSGQVQQTLSGSAFRIQMVVVLVVVLIAFGLYSASGHARGEG
ncbi:MAG: hypothetical protein GXX94_06415 [Chloroflexi bacterium]|nr:hypothetical protein [Chloroflexota bacterium]